jgi:hypothetical protein
VAVTPKPQAEAVLVAPEGDPIVAAWQYGSGRTVAWTPDLGVRWSAAWQNSPSAAAFWGNVFSWLLPSPDSSELAIRVDRVDDRSAAILVENRSAWDEVRATRAALIGRDGVRRELDLEPSGPGRYRAVIDTPPIGAYIVQASQTVAGAEVLGEVGWVAPFPAEYRHLGLDRPTLTRIAAAGGGALLNDAIEAVRPPERTAAARWPAAGLLLVLAAIFWPLEIAFRRLAIPPETRAYVTSHLRLPTRPVTAAQAPSPTANGHAAPPPSVATADRLLRRKQSFRALRRRPD